MVKRTKLFSTKLPYISVCNTNLSQGFSGKKICGKKTVTIKNLNKNTGQ